MSPWWKNITEQSRVVAEAHGYWLGVVHTTWQHLPYTDPIVDIYVSPEIVFNHMKRR